MNTSKVDRFTCTGCGFCCMQAKCGAALRLYPSAKVCPQLLWSEEDNRYYCGLMQLPGLIGESYRAELYAGVGCCSNLNSWRRDVKRRTPDEDISLEAPIDQICQYLVRSLAEEMISQDVISLSFGNWNSKLVKAGYNKNHVDRIIQYATHVYNENKSSMFKSFI